jgi:large subunit ribosomal protein L9
MGNVQVILAESIPNLGDQGQVVNVKGGFARNFLIPQGLAFAASSSNASQIAHKQKQLLDLRKRKVKNDQDFAARLSEVSVRIAVKVGEEDRLFGSVTSQHIADAVTKKGFKIDRRKIVLAEPIRALGVYTVPVRLAAEIEGNVKVWVVKEE